MSAPVPEPLRTLMVSCFNERCWASSWDSWEGFMRGHVARLSPSDRATLRQQFAEAIVRATVTAAQFHELTGDREVQTGNEWGLKDLLVSCWQKFYGRDGEPEDFTESPG